MSTIPRANCNSYRDSTAPPIFSTHIAETREQSIQDEERDESTVKIYSDGSGLDGKVGAAASLYLYDYPDPEATAHLHLGGAETHSTYEAELTGLLLALWLLITKASYAIGQRKINIYVDNQSVIHAINSDNTGPADYLKEEFHRLCDTYIKRPEGTQGNDQMTPLFTIRWISAHSEVWRNECIDEEAKEAARGKTSSDFDLPRMLRRSLPISKSALKQKLKSETTARSNALWVKSPRFDKYAELEDNFQFKKFHKIADKLNRYKLTLLVKLRINHLPTNAYLRSKRLAQSSDCEKCGTGAKETVNHFIHDCRAYTLQRHRLYDKIKDNERNLKKILIDEDSTLALLEYIEDTKRFPKKSFQIIDRPTNQQST
ncbi:hypothetical protein BJ165DRAFT_1351311 [Panaeolus papilionaceus]|nr:hypothetical protein BJ165DRAFT_1351311 [Panaeolus papilionaceus]